MEIETKYRMRKKKHGTWIKAQTIEKKNLETTHQVESHRNAHAQVLPRCEVVTSPGGRRSLTTDKACSSQHKRPPVFVGEQHPIICCLCLKISIYLQSPLIKLLHTEYASMKEHFNSEKGWQREGSAPHLHCDSICGAGHLQAPHLLGGYCCPA